MSLGELTHQGPVVLLLLGLSVVAVTVLLERGLFWVLESLRRRRYLPDQDLREEAEGAVRDPQWPRVPALGRILRSVGCRRGASRAEVEAALGLEDLWVRRGLVVVETVVAVAPMLGILGTVLGLMDAFQGLAGADRDPRVVIQGLSSALLTTAIGLMVALAGIPPLRLLHARAELSMRQVEAELAGLGMLPDPGEGAGQ